MSRDHKVPRPRTAPQLEVVRLGLGLALVAWLMTVAPDLQLFGFLASAAKNFCATRHLYDSDIMLALKFADKPHQCHALTEQI